MRIGVIGLEKIGTKLSKKLLQKGHQVLGYDLNNLLLQPIIDHGGVVTEEMNTFVDTLNKLRIPVVWLTIPPGENTRETLKFLGDRLKPGSIIIDSSNSNYKDTVENYHYLKRRNIHLLDIGISGSINGYKNGFCFMVGGDIEAYNFISPVLYDLASKNGYNYLGPSGSGHLVKMVHNNIEQTFLEAIGEGLNFLEESKIYNLNIKEITKLWQNGSNLNSSILELTAGILEKDPHLDLIYGIKGARSKEKDTFKHKVITSVRKNIWLNK
ncbi:MAG: NAD(P)-binding domain-containing protein [Cetobacterium sp.]